MAESNLPIQWYASLRGTAPVSTVQTEEHIYATSNGYVYCISASDGEILFMQDCTEVGDFEASIVLSTDKSRLFVAIRRWLLAFDPITMTRNWYVEIPMSKFKTNLFAHGDCIYTGSFGRICEFDLHGNVKHQTSVGFGSNVEVRVDICRETGVLYAASGVFISAFQLPGLKEIWHQETEGEGLDIMSVLYKQGLLWIAYYGYVLRLDVETGEELARANVGASSQGYAEVNLAADVEKNRLYAGTNGFGVLLNATTLSEDWAFSFPNSGNHITSVMMVGRTSVYGSQGRVFQLTPDQTLVGRNDMKGYGDSNTPIARLHNGMLLVCPDGYVATMNISEDPEI